MSVVFVGNDIVDLGLPRTEGRAADERFVGRVYDAEEQASIRAAVNADLELWTRWAAKEAGFKAISKLIGAPPPFVHRAFKVEWAETTPRSETEPGDVVRRGLVTFEGYRAEVAVALHPGNLHALAFTGAEGPEAVELHPRIEFLDAPDSRWSGPMEALRRRFTDSELDAVYSRASAATRLAARAHLARAMSVDESRLEIVCDRGPTGRRPPRVMLDGAPAGADVSLSHDGRWIAWVLWVATHRERT